MIVRTILVCSVGLLAVIPVACIEVPLKPLDGVPDGRAEILRVSEVSSHGIEHEAATFLAAIRQPDQVVLLDFWGPHCPPCLEVAPELEDVVRVFGEKVSVVKINVELPENAELTSFFEIIVIPEMRFYVRGEPAGGIRGFADKETISRKLQPLVESL